MGKTVDVTMCPQLLGSMTNPTGDVLLLHVKDEDGAEHMIGLPHWDIPRLIEMAAIQIDPGTELRGETTRSAFITKSFSVGRGDQGEIVLDLTIGQNGKLSFLLPGKMVAQLADVFQGLRTGDGSRPN